MMNVSHDLQDHKCDDSSNKQRSIIESQDDEEQSHYVKNHNKNPRLVSNTNDENKFYNSVLKDTIKNSNLDMENLENKNSPKTTNPNRYNMSHSAPFKIFVQPSKTNIQSEIQENYDNKEDKLRNISAVKAL